LLTLQLAVAVIVLVGASLLVKSFAKLTDVDLGFDPQNLITMSYDLSETIRSARTEPERRAALVETQRQLVQRLQALPGLEAVTLSDAVFRPITTSRGSLWFDDGREFLNGNPEQRAFAPRMHRIGPDYFRMQGVKPVTGREFTGQDTLGATPAVVVNEAMVRMHWPNTSPIGRRVNFRGQTYVSGKFQFTDPWFEVIGVVPDIRYGSVDAPVIPEIYRSIAQEPTTRGYVVLKPAAPLADVAAAARDAIRQWNQQIPVYPARTMGELVDESTAMTRYNAGLLSACAGIATILCGFGVYSMLAYAVAARRRELGIRIALGAAPRRLVGDVLREARWLLVMGVGGGVVLALFATSVLSTLLYDVSPRDPAVFVVASLSVVVLALTAAWLPARAAARLDPVRALKID
jgi:predicted permease